MENEIRLYSEADFAESRKTKKKAIRRMFFCALPFLAGAAVCFALRLQTACALCMIAFCSALIFLYDLQVKPSVRYARCLSEMKSGSFVRISEDLTYEEGVNFREVIINVYEDMDEEGERRFLLDERREIPREWLNRDIVITSFGNMVTGVRLHNGGENA